MRQGHPKVTPHTLEKAMAAWMHNHRVADALLQPRLGPAPGSPVTRSVHVGVTTGGGRTTAGDLAAEWRRDRAGTGEKRGAEVR